VGEPEPMEAPTSSAPPLVYAHMRGREQMSCRERRSAREARLHQRRRRGESERGESRGA